MRTRPLSTQFFEEAVGAPLTSFAHQCHAASIALVKSGVFEVARVARGVCPGVMGQHSWVVLSMDAYDPEATVVDPTLWSYDDKVEGIYVGRARVRPHHPHGFGSIFDWGKPTSSGGEPIVLEGLSASANAFLNMLGPLDLKGWISLSQAPVLGWPAAEIIGAMWKDPVLGPLVPIDRVGMLTDINPQGLYLRGEEKKA